MTVPAILAIKLYLSAKVCKFDTTYRISLRKSAELADAAFARCDVIRGLVIKVKQALGGQQDCSF